MTRTARSIAAALALTAGIASADVITVGPNLTDFDHITITAAIAAAVSGDEIVIAPGLYPENLVIGGKDIELRNAGGGVVTIYGQDLERCLLLPASSGSDVVLRGLHFLDGNTAGGGGGIAISGGTSAVIDDCVIESCEAAATGGGIYVAGIATITNTTITGNMAASTGGGIALVGAALTTMTDCIIENNHSDTEGGGLSYANAGERATISHCLFELNTAGVRGGAIAVLGTAAVGTLRTDFCRFVDNVASNAGGAIWISDQDVFRAINSVFSGNNAASAGGAIHNEQIFDAVNCTFFGNTSDDAAAADTFNSQRSDADTNLLNCIVVNDSASSESGPGDLQAAYSLIPEGPSGTADGSGNFNADAMFSDAGSGDFSLMPGSPAIDAGHSLGLLGPVAITSLLADLAGNVRNLDDPDVANTGVPAWELNIDLGAFEYQPNPTPDCAVDFNGDGVLDFFDVSLFLSGYNAGCP